MKRLFLTVFDLNKALQRRSQLTGDIFCVKQMVGVVLGSKGIENYAFYNVILDNNYKDLQDTAKVIFRDLSHQSLWHPVPDLRESFATILTDIEDFQNLTWDGKKSFLIPKESSFQGKDSILELEEKWSHQILNKLSFENPALNSFISLLSTTQSQGFTSRIHEELEKTLLRTGPLDRVFNSHSTEVKTALEKRNAKPKLLLHVCCGPDAAGVISQLKKDFDLHCFWYDPNIQPFEEHDLRLQAFIQVANLEKVPYTIGEYDVDRFESTIKGLEFSPEKGAKCSLCYDMRLERAAIEAKNKNFDLYTTTLAISPHKVQQKLQTFGKLFEAKHGIPYLARNFLKFDGFKDSVEYTKEHNIYRQDYCGCFYSLWEGGAEARKKAHEWGYLPTHLKATHERELHEKS